MSNIKKLLKGVEVEWKPLGEMFNLRNGYTPSKSNQEYWENGTIPWFRMEDIRENGRLLNKSIQYVNSCAIKGGKLFPANSIIVATSATIGEHALITVPFLSNQRFTNLSLKREYADKFKIKFLFYYGFVLDEWCKKNTTVGNFAGVDMIGFKKFLIPIPPLEIQQEIVRILDKFSTLTAELQAELQARKSQYEYYRNQLLIYPMEVADQPSLRSSRSATSIQSSDNPMQPLSISNPHTGNSVLQPHNKVGWKILGEIGEVCMCKRILKEQTSDAGDIPFYKIGTFGKKPNAYISKELFDEYKSKYNYPKIGEVLISASGTIGRAVIFDGRDAYFQDSNIVWIENDESQVLNRYLFYVYQITKWEISEGGTIQRLYNDNLKKTRIPIPYPNDIKKSFEEQERIIAILDKFDTLTTSITEGLPKEIELRQKQYEYYRDMLLTFPTDNIKA